MMTHVLAAEGGYQAVHLDTEVSGSILIGSALTALLALAVGFVLMRGVLAARPGHAEDERDRQGDPGRRAWRT